MMRQFDGFLEVCIAPKAAAPPNNKPAVSDITLPVKDMYTKWSTCTVHQYNNHYTLNFHFI